MTFSEDMAATRQTMKDRLEGYIPLEIATSEIEFKKNNQGKVITFSRVVASKRTIFKKSKITHAVDTSKSVTTIDWLRTTTNDLESFNATMNDLLSDEGLFAHADLQVQWKNKGIHGYERSAAITLWRDNDYLTVGTIAMSEAGQNKGGLFELTGVGCKVLSLENPELWLELYSLLQYHEWRISRIDMALDLMGQYAIDNGYTVPKLLQKAKNDGLFKSSRQRNPEMQPALGQAGDWTDFSVGNLTAENYDPLVDCPAGLTAYIGNRKSADDYFRIYEKAKELLGKMAEPESVDRGWVRIEHEMMRGASGRVIPLDVMLNPDKYFCADRPAVRAIMNKVREDHKDKLENAAEWQREQFKKEKGLLLSKKIHWCKHSYGRLLSTLVDQGIDAQDIIGQLTRVDGLKEFVFDLARDGTPEPQTTGLNLKVAA